MNNKNLELKLVRNPATSTDKFTKGEMLANGVHLGYVCEDADRFLEKGGIKVPGETAIPRGKYRVIISFSQRFQRNMPEVLGVPDFSGIRIHGGNTAMDTHGCPLLGLSLTPDGVRDCASVNSFLMKEIGDTLFNGGECWLEVI